MILKLLSRLFGAAEEINGHDRCPTYLYRWHLWKLFGWKVYVHHFVADDWCLDCHDHPKRFISIGLWGRYEEIIEHGDIDLKTAITQEHRYYHAPWIRSFPAKHRHRIRMVDGHDAWTLVIVTPTQREWGFWHDGVFQNWREYVGSEMADRMKACQ